MFIRSNGKLLHNMEYIQSIVGKVVDVIHTNGFLYEGSDGLGQVRDRMAFLDNPFKKGDQIKIIIESLMDAQYVQSIIDHPTKTWKTPNSIIWIGVVNKIGMNSFDLKELRKGESPFWEEFFYAERSFISNSSRHIDDLPIRRGDVIKLEVRLFKETKAFK